MSGLKTNGYSWLLIIASVAYLFVEIVFNLSLMEAIAAVDLVEATIHGVEEFGRRASSTGFTLAVLGVFLTRDFVVRSPVRWVVLGLVALLCAAPVLLTNEFVHTLHFIVIGLAVVIISGIYPDRGDPRVRSVASLIGLCVMAWPAFYYGKVSVTNHYLINNASGQERLAARYVTMLRRGLATDTVKLQDVALADFGGTEHPEAKAFLVMLGPLLLSNGRLLEKQMTSSTPAQMVRALASKRQIVNISERYNDYTAARERFIRDVYAPYIDGSRQYVERNAALKDTAAETWQALQADLDRKWPQYQKGESQFIDSYVALTRSVQFGRRMNRHVDERIDCGWDKACLRKQDREYDRMMRSLLQGRDPPPFDFWCSRKQVAILNIYVCNDTSSTPAGKRLAQWDQEQFGKHPANAAGLPLGLKSKNEYLLSPELSRYVAHTLNEQHGVVLPQQWTITDQAGFYAAFLRAAEERSDAQWKEQTTTSLGEAVEPGLSLDQLVRVPAVNRRIRQRMGNDYVEGFNLSWSEKEYAEQVIYPALERIVVRELEAFRVGSAEYANGGAREQQGKALLQAALVPPIAVALSLLFSFLSAAKVSAVLFGSLVIGVFRIRSYGKTLVKSVFWVAPIAIMCAIPFLRANPYAESQAWLILLQEARQEAPAVAAMAEYVIRVEPAFAAAGYPLMNVFDPYNLSPAPSGGG